MKWEYLYVDFEMSRDVFNGVSYFNDRSKERQLWTFFRGMSSEQVLSILGREGWEMVQQAPSTWNNRLPTFYFKRQTS